MSDLTFGAKYKVICTECARDVFEQVEDKIRCLNCGAEYQRPDNLIIEPFDIEIEKKEEH